MGYDRGIIEIASVAAAAAAKNASSANKDVPPQLLVADIIFTLDDAVKNGKLILPQADPVLEKKPCEGVLEALRNLRRSVEDNFDYRGYPKLVEEMEHAAVVLGRGY